MELTEDTFDKHVSTGYHFVKFYAPWCDHCQKLAPTWEELANSLRNDNYVSISKVDCTQHRNVCGQFNIKGYPTLLWIEDGKKVKFKYRFYFFFCRNLNLSFKKLISIILGMYEYIGG